MSRYRKSSPVASVVDQAKQRIRASRNVSDPLCASNSKLPVSRIDQSPDPKSGDHRMRIILPHPTKPKIIDLTSLLQAPAWAALLAEGFRVRSEFSAATTIYTESLSLSKIASFFATTTQQLNEVDETIWTAFVAWLDAPYQNGRLLEPKSKRETLGVLRRTIEAVLDDPQYQEVSEFLLYRSGFPVNPWPNSNRKSIPTPVLRPDERQRLIEVCLSEIEEIGKQHKKHEDLLLQGKQRLAVARRQNSKPPYYAIGVCAARLDDLTCDQLLAFDDVRNLDATFLSAIIREHGGINIIRRVLYNTNRDLVPFVVLLGIKTAFNPSTLLGLTWSNVRGSYDESTISITGKKPRAKVAQTSTHESKKLFRNVPSEPGVSGGLDDVLNLLKAITQRTRCLADPSERDLLFVSAQFHVSAKVSSFFSREGLEARITPKAFRDFRERHLLPFFNLKMLRATEAEIEYRRTGDLLAVKDRMGHKNAKVTRTHYTSDWVRRHGQDRIGATQELLLRWAATEGRCDPRGSGDLREAPAATRGFGCLDPYDSPRIGQRKGQLCKAYGECPSCPMMLARPLNPQSVAFYLALRMAILEGKRGLTSGHAWSTRWAQVTLDLEYLIQEVPADVKAAALRFRVILPPVS